MEQQYIQTYVLHLEKIMSNLETPVIDKHFLCHYTSASSLKSILESKTLHFTKWDFLNDESEMIHIHDVVKRCIKLGSYSQKFNNLVLSINQIAEQLMRDYSYPLEDDYYILSLSSNPDSLPMWSYYTKSQYNDGYNIDFEANELLTSLKSNMNEIKNIKIIRLWYDDIEKERCVNSILDELYELYCSLDDYKETENDVVMLLEFSLSVLAKYFKHKAFEHEMEYRILVNANTTKEKTREKNGLFIPYIELSFDKDYVKRVNISPTLSKRNAQVGLETFLKNNGYSCKIKQSNIPFRNI